MATKLYVEASEIMAAVAMTLSKENRVDEKFVLPDGYRKGRDPDNVTNFS